MLKGLLVHNFKGTTKANSSLARNTNNNKNKMTSPMMETVSQQIRSTFFEEAQIYLNELQNQVSELDPSLPNFRQKISQLLTTNKSLRVTAIKADFYTHTSSFVVITDRFEQVLIRLRDRNFSIDRGTKDLIIEVINIIGQIINEYCSNLEEPLDWLELQNNLFEKINESLNEDLDLNSDRLEISGAYDKAEEPFNLDDTLEALHLFDEEDFGIENLNNDLSETDLEQRDNSNAFFLIELDDRQQQDNEKSLSFGENLQQNFSERVTTLFPSMLSNNLENDFDDQFDNFPEHIGNQNQFVDQAPRKDESSLGNEDETELQGVKWNHREDDLDNHWNRFPSLEPWMEIGTIDDSETKKVFPEQDFSNSSISIATKDIDDVLADNVVESLTEDDNMFWNPLELIESKEDIDSFERSENKFEESSHEVDSLKFEPVQLQDFSTSDIDTAIEESPIYQNKSKNFYSPDENLALVDFEAQQLDFTDLSLETSLNSADSSSNLSSNLNSKVDENLDLNLISSNQSNHHELVHNHDTTIRIPTNYLEKWEDLSEEVLVQKGNLDVYLGEMRTLSGEAQKALQLLEPESISLTQGAIADLKNTLENLSNVIDRTEKQTYEMSRDVHNLRKNFRQVLKHPISTLVRKFPRILRDLSLRHNKQVELIVQGSEIGIERVLSEVVGETLEMLIRNVFENSIESPDERQREGKTLHGQIELIAMQTDDATIIKVIDDGRGFDDLSNNISENIAGLGDIRKKLSDVGGTISISSETNKGNQFIVTLPNTTSLLRVLLVDIEEICLAISSNVILEVILMEYSHDSSNQDTLLWRDRVIPIVRLNSLLKLNCQHNVNQISSLAYQSSNSINQSERYRSASTAPAFLIMQHEHNFFALQTNGCWSEQEAILHQIEGDISLPNIFLGAVILGNNQAIALIDHLELINQCLQSHENIEVLSPQNNQPNIDNSSLENLNSLSDFFGNGDPDQDSDISGLLDQPVRFLESLSEPENLESSSIFTSDIYDAEKMKLRENKVLIVESSANVRRYLAMTLARSGFLTEQVQNGKEAIAFLKERLRDKLDIDLVITDLEMHHMDGFKLLSALRADPSLHNLPIVVLTTGNNENDQKLALELGANAYFSKPYREQELVKTLQDLISR